MKERFENAQQNDIHVEERTCDLEEIVNHVAESGTVIVLTNANLLTCETCNFFSLCGQTEVGSSCLLLRTCASSAYQGHYVLVVGYDLPKRKIVYRNPTLRDRSCVMSFDQFNEARTSYGTDEDIIFVGSRQRKSGYGP